MSQLQYPLSGAGGGGFLFTQTLLPFAPSVDLNFATGGYFGAIGGPSSFLTTVRATPPALAVDAGGTWTSFAANVPRITNLGLLVEESRTNIVLGFANGWSVNQVTVSNTGSPDGGTNALLITDNAVSNPHYTFSPVNTTVSGTTYAASAFFKAGTAGFAGVSFVDGGFVDGFYACVNLATGAITTSGALGLGTFALAYSQVYPNGWVRITAIGTPGTTNTFCVLSILPNAAANPATSYVGTGSTISGWAGQAEVGSSSTSPIPTTSAAVTRAADVITMTTPPVFGSAYTFFGSGVPQAPINYPNNQLILRADDGTASNQATLFKTSATGNAQVTSFSAAVGINIPLAVWSPGVPGKLAESIAAGNQLASFNAGAVGTGNGALPIGINTVRMGNNQTGGNQWNGTIARVALWPTVALTGPQLQVITT